MGEQPFEVEIPGGTLRGHRGGSGAPALLLHGGAAVPDYLDGLAAELADVFTTFRYTQRGTKPSTGGPPFTIEAHMDDVLAVLDGFDIERAWLVGHSWGAHLALHVLVSHPGRVLGVVCIDPLPDAGVFVELDANLRRRLAPDQIVRLDEVEDRRRVGEVTEEDLIERFALVWPGFFHRPEPALPSPGHVGVEAYIGTNQSLAEHFERGTLAQRLPSATVPALFVHGEQSVIPPRASAATCGLVPGAEFVTVAECGHFPWIEQPGSVRNAVCPFLAR